MCRPPHILLLLFFPLLHLATAQNGTRTVDVGVVLDLGSMVGTICSTCLSMAVDDFYAAQKNYTTRLTLHAQDSKGDVLLAASAAWYLERNVSVEAIIGPQTSVEAEFVAYIGNKSQLPILSFSATSPSLSSNRTRYFVRTAHDDSSLVKPIAAIVNAFGWKRVVSVFEDSDDGDAVLPYLTDALQEVQVQVPFRSTISPSANDVEILKELYKLMTMQTRVFVVHMNSSLGSRFFMQVKEVGMMSRDYVWIITDGLTSILASKDSSVIGAMQGVLGVKPFVPRSKARDNFMVRWKEKYGKEIDDAEEEIEAVLIDHGLRAYDTAWAVAMAVEQVDDSATGVSRNGPELLDAILNINFPGLGGEFRLVDGQLELSAFQIVNLVGNEERVIGYWTPTAGISRNLSAKSTNKEYSAYMADLGAIIWPGESTVVPTGWVIPTNAKKLRVAVPPKVGFSEFMKVKRDNQTNRTTVTGFSIAVFDLAMAALPYAVVYEFVPFANAAGTEKGTYDDLVSNFTLMKYDAIVGDITITFNRSKYVDFSLPYTESGIAMLVALKGDNSKKAWVFLKPWTLELWVTTGTFFILTGIVVWILEHRINGQFRAAPSHQLGVIFYFSFSTMVYSHKETINSNLSRFVVIVWLFVVLILSSSYTASLTSMLTVPKMKPTFKDMDSLRRSGRNVGYQNDSFVLDVLKDMGFDGRRLRAYSSPHEYAEALSRGSQNGGVDAIIDEIPYLNIFLAKYCNNYTMIGPIAKNGGLGFAFPKGSSLVPDVSRAILNATEGDKLWGIERAWFGLPTTCPVFASDGLTLQSFWGLFVITGTVSSTAFIIFMVSLFHEKVIALRGKRALLWQIVVDMATHLNKKNLKVSAIADAEPTDSGTNDVRDVEGATDPSVVGEELAVPTSSRHWHADASNLRRRQELRKSWSFPYNSKI